jgi:hypothetical protein
VGEQATGAEIAAQEAGLRVVWPWIGFARLLEGCERGTALYGATVRARVLLPGAGALLHNLFTIKTEEEFCSAVKAAPRPA